MAESSPPPPSAADRQLKLATHQAQNLEHLKQQGEWMRGRVESIDAMLTARLDETVSEMKAANQKLWHVVLWLYIAVILTAASVLASLGE